MRVFLFVIIIISYCSSHNKVCHFLAKWVVIAKREYTLLESIVSSHFDYYKLQFVCFYVGGCV